MYIARFLCARLPSENLDQRRLAVHQALQRGLHFAQIIKVMHALDAAAKLARGLRTTEQQLAENGSFATIEVEGFLQAMFVLGDAAVGSADRARQRIIVQYA